VRGHPGNEIAPNAQGYKLDKIAVVLPDETASSQKARIIDLGLDLGSSICETRHPVLDEPAICCTSVGETRSENYRPLLDVLMQR
jgi:hypothetical protein